MGRVTYYERDGLYLALTKKSPKGFRGVAFICHKGDSPGNVREDVTDKNRLEDWTKVDAADVPDDWFDAFGLEKRPKPKPKPKPKRKKRKKDFDCDEFLGIDLNEKMSSFNSTLVACILVMVVLSTVISQFLN